MNPMYGVKPQPSQEYVLPSSNARCRMSSVRVYLKQLKQPELMQLAKRKHAKISDTVSKGELIKILAPFVSQSEVLRMFRKNVQGAEALISGEHFERKALGVFKRMGYSCELNVRIKGSEFDIVGDRKKSWSGGKQWVLAECKNKPKVLLNDFMKFVGKLNTFQRRHPDDEVQGYIVTSGVFDSLLKSAKRDHPEIQLKRIKA